eukprot:7910338-Pyramimonas_sp.AAC.1
MACMPHADCPPALAEPRWRGGRGAKPSTYHDMQMPSSLSRGFPEDGTREGDLDRGPHYGPERI